MFLTSQDFEVINNELIKKNDQGFSLVFFFIPECIYCDDVKPAFEKLANTIRGCAFEYCNVDIGLQRKSEFTKTPITYVPLLFLFARGRIISQFFPDESNPNRNEQIMTTFLQQSIENYNFKMSQPKTPFESEVQQTQSYTGYGIPYNVSQKRVCKLFKNAYIT